MKCWSSLLSLGHSGKIEMPHLSLRCLPYSRAWGGGQGGGGGVPELPT